MSDDASMSMISFNSKLYDNLDSISQIGGNENPGTNNDGNDYISMDLGSLSAELKSKD